MSGKNLFDQDNPEWTEADFAAAKPPEEVLPADVLRAFPKTRGPQKSPTKAAISIRLDADVVERFRNTGPGWQGRINRILREAKLA